MRAWPPAASVASTASRDAGDSSSCLAAAAATHSGARQELVEALVTSLLHDGEVSVRDEARTALEQLEDPQVLQRLQTLVDEGFLG